MADAFGLSDVSTPDTGKGSELKTGGRRKYNMPKSQGKSLSYASYDACIKSAREKGVDESPCYGLKKPGKEKAPPAAQKAGKMKNPKPKASKYPGSV